MLKFKASGYTDHAPVAFRPLIRVLCANSSVSAFIHSSARALVQEVASGRLLKDDPRKLRMLYNACPVLYHLICNTEFTEIPDELKMVLKDLLRMADAPYQSDAEVGISDEITSRDEPKGSFFPSLKFRRRRKRYKQDKKSHKSENRCKPTNTKGHRSLLPGIFCLFCEHGMSYKFQLILFN